MSLFDELKRRKVFKVGVAYLVVGWLLIQVASTVAPQLNLPEWAPRLVTFVILLGFPIALVLAWIFDVTPEGIKVDEAPVGNKRMIAVAAILAALAVGWYWKTRPAAGQRRRPTRARSPCCRSSTCPTTRATSISPTASARKSSTCSRAWPDLHVAARTSSFSFRKQEKEIPTIARELKVRMVLEGSVRKQGDRVRVTAQLIDASNGYHVWSQTYDRDLKDIFAIQDEIAGAIAQELKLKLDARACGRRSRRRHHRSRRLPALPQGDGLVDRRAASKNLLAGRSDCSGRARKRDPNYAKAWAGLALTYAILPEWSSRPLAETRPAGRDAAEHALALDRDLPEPYAVLGYIAATEFRFATARAMFKRSIALAPSYATGYQWSGETLRWEGDLDAALVMIRKARGARSEVVDRQLGSRHAS